MKQEMMTIVSQKQLAPRIFELVLQGKLVGEMQKPGQFIHIKVPRADLLLRRPISLSQINQEEQTCTIIYRVEGDGTRYFSEMSVGDQLDVMGPLGNGFDTSVVSSGQTAFIVGGGIGVPPLYELSKQLKAKGVNVVHFLGFASRDVMYYKNEFLALDDTRFSTDDGSYGVHGHVGNMLVEALKDGQPDAVYACGATGMLKTVDQLFHDHPHAYLSLESRMACGMGACYACVCHLQDDETGTKSKKVCDQGPIFHTGEVVL